MQEKPSRPLAQKRKGEARGTQFYGPRKKHVEESLNYDLHVSLSSYRLKSYGAHIVVSQWLLY